MLLNKNYHELIVTEDDELNLAQVELYFSSEEGKLNAGDPPLLTRSQKKARKGLPKLVDLISLAEVWLEENHRHWPELVKAGVVPANTLEVAQRLASEYEQRFVHGEVVEFRSEIRTRSC